MINEIDSNKNLLNIDTSIQQNQEVQNAQTVNGINSKNSYINSKNTLVDESNISQEAVNLYQKEQELNKYVSFLDDITDEEATNRVAELMEQGVFKVSDEELAESIFTNIPTLNELFN